MLSFERPLFLAALLLIPALILGRRVLRGRPYALRFQLEALGEGSCRGPLSSGLPSRLPPPRPPILGSLCLFGAEAFLWLGLALALVAAAGPSRVSRRILLLSRGNAIIFAIDVSPSMAAGDFSPTRLDAAKEIIGDFLDDRRNETVGLVAFGGEAALVCPPTLDYAVFRRRLGELKPGIFGEGSALGSGLGVALVHAARLSAPERYIVLLTDGENNAGAVAPETAADLAKSRGIAVEVIGVGSRGEAPVSYIDPETGVTRSGTYRSGFDRAALEKLARSGGGRYFAAETPQALEQAFSEVSDQSASLAATRSISTEDSLAKPFLALAFALLLVARLLGLAAGGDFL